MGQVGLTVFCVYWGTKYNKAYVYALKEMVERNLTIPHHFICITSEHFDGIETIEPAVDYPGWWQKIGLFAPGIATGPSLYFDIDVIITGNIDYIVQFTDSKLSAPANWAQSGHGGIQSSVMAWRGGWHDPFNRFSYKKDSGRFWGDQEFIWEMLGDDWTRIPHIGSYKYHCRKGIPDWLKVCVFHGKPDPHEVDDKWILPYTSILRSRINSNMQNGSNVGLIATG